MSRPISRRGTLLLIGLALLLYWLMAVSVSPRMGVTGDEVVHLTGGYSYWTLNDYRMHPENGNLAQRIAALPLTGMHLSFPSLDEPSWIGSKVNFFGEKFIFEQGNDVDRMLLVARMMIALSGVVVVWLTYHWSKTLFGKTAGWIALTLAVFCPALLAHGGLATSDMVMTACVIGALSAVWRLMHRVTWIRLLIATVTCGLAFLSKMSGVIIIPVIALLVMVRCLYPTPLIIAIGETRRLRSTRSKFTAIIMAMLFTAVGSLAVVWAGFGFRYSGFNPHLRAASGYYFTWDVVLGKEKLPSPQGASLYQLLPRRSQPEHTTIDRAIEWIRDHKLLPEAYLWGFAQTSQFARYRPAYLMGELRTQGWAKFFPIAFVLKTPPAGLLLGFTGLLALLCARFSKQHRSMSSIKPWLYRASPLLAFFVLYWCMALTMNLNIGHRHILPTYPVFYILASASVIWLTAYRRTLIAIGLVGCLALHAGESIFSRPFYLSYFQSLAGGSERGYHYLVDSSFDWGQGLPDLKRWISFKESLGDKSPVFLSYFGSDSPRRRGINSVRFGDFMTDSDSRVFPAILKGGWYVISATNFVQTYAATRGPWTKRKEFLYREIQARLARPEARNPQTAAEKEKILLDCQDLETLQAARLFTYLKDHEPVAIIGGSLLLFNLTSDDLKQALYGFRTMSDQP